MSQRLMFMFSDMLNIQSPWVIHSLQYDKIELNLSVYLGLDSNYISCPLCNRSGRIIGNVVTKWIYLDMFEYKTQMFTCLPVVDAHNPVCRAEHDQSALQNTVLLDLILKISKNAEIIKPLEMFLRAAI